MQMCHDQGYKIAGVEFGVECWCDNRKEGNPVKSPGCNKTCSGSKEEKCGGKFAINVLTFSCSGSPDPTPPPTPAPPTPVPLPAPYPVNKPCDKDPLKSSIVCDHTQDIDKRVEKLVSLIPIAELANLYSDETVGVPSLNIPPYNWWSEALHGVSRCPYQQGSATPSPDTKKGDSGCCFTTSSGDKKCPTSFPAGITTGCSLNKTLMFAIGTAVGTEARAVSNAGQASLTFWTPNVNIFRDPRWGRGQETPGEDPTVNSDYAAGFVGGFQTGEDPTRIKASACCKHYAAYNLEKWGPDGPHGATVDRHHFNAGEEASSAVIDQDR
jgi:beta-D-xylosidase 4